jgi:hypothetical protein
VDFIKWTMALSLVSSISFSIFYAMVWFLDDICRKIFFTCLGIHNLRILNGIIKGTSIRYLKYPQHARYIATLLYGLCFVRIRWVLVEIRPKVGLYQISHFSLNRTCQPKGKIWLTFPGQDIIVSISWKSYARAYTKGAFDR